MKAYNCNKYVALTLCFCAISTFSFSQWEQGIDSKIYYSKNNVGIGLMNPIHTLDVSGDINIGPTNSFKINSFDILKASAFGEIIKLGNDASSSWLFGTDVEDENYILKFREGITSAGLKEKGIFVNHSDSESKEEVFNQVDVLQAILDLPIIYWKYKEFETWHLGPNAQDFNTYLMVGDEKTIAGSDLGGAALKGIKQLASEYWVRSLNDNFNQYALNTGNNIKMIGIGVEDDAQAPLHVHSHIADKGLLISREGKQTTVSLHVAENEDYGYLHLGGDTRLRGNGKTSYFQGKLGVGITNPNTKFEANGIIRASNTDQDEYTEIWHGGSNGYINTVGDGNLQLRHSNDPKVSILPNGNTGIGLETPQKKLDVDGTIRASNTPTEFLEIGRGPSSGFINMDSDGRLEFRQGGSPKMSILPNGRFGVGTSSPKAKIESIGTVRASVSNQTEYTEIWHDGSNGYINTVGDGRLQIKHDGIAKVSILSNGRMGVGYTDPNAKFETNGNIRASTSNKAEYTEIAHGGNHGYINTVGDGNLDFRHDGNTKMTITPAGDVGIGTTSPKYDLDVSGTVGTHYLYPKFISDQYNFIRFGQPGEFWAGFMYNKTDPQYGAGDNYCMYTYGHKDLVLQAFQGNILIGNQYHAGNVGVGKDPGGYRLDVNGTVRAVGYYHLSDRRFKKQIRNLERSLDKVAALRGVSYYFDREKYSDIKFGEQEQIGLIAQEVQEVLPHLVSQDADGYLSVSYGALIPVLIEAIKELKEDNDWQSEHIEDLKLQLASFTNASSSKVSQFDNTTIAVGDQDDGDGVTMLYQNSPNPFSTSTTIRYVLAENINQAAIYIYDMNGRQLMKHSLSEKGQGQIMVSGGALVAGMYLYALIVDGKQVDTKRMILTE